MKGIVIDKFRTWFYTTSRYSYKIQLVNSKDKIEILGMPVSEIELNKGDTVEITIKKG